MDNSSFNILQRLSGRKVSCSGARPTPVRPTFDPQCSKGPPKLTGHHPPSTAEPSTLSPISWNDLKTDTRHHGQAIYIRVISTRRDLGSVFSVIDSRGEEGEVWSLLAQPLGVELAANTPVIAVKEPYYGVTPRGKPAICLHHPTDCVYVSRADERLRERFSALGLSERVDYLAEGDSAFLGADFLGAIDLYTLGMEAIRAKTPNETTKLSSSLAKRSFAYSRSGAIHTALQDAQAAVEVSNEEPSTLKLVSSAAFRCDMPSLASQYAAQLLEKFKAPSESQVQLLDRSLNGVQQAAGNYQFGKLISVVSTTGKCPEVAPYTGSIEVQPSPLGGRGMFATKDLVAGDLLLCEKPVALAAGHENSKFGDGVLDVLLGEKTSGRVLYLLQQLSSKAIVDPAAGLIDKIFSLHSDGEYDAAKGHFNSYHALSILKHNQHTILPGCMSDHHDRGDPANKMRPSRAVASAADQTPGLWLKASKFNHSCLPNCCWSWIGDLFLVRATRDIPAGEELTLAYVPNSYDLEKRNGIFKRNNGFECSCALCVADGAVGEAVRLQRKMLQLTLKPGPMLAVDEGVVKQLMQTYQSSAYDEVPKVQMADAFLLLANVKLGDIRNWKSASRETNLEAEQCFLDCLQIGLGIAVLRDAESGYCQLVHTKFSLAKAVGVLALMGMAELAFHDGAMKRCAALKVCAKEVYKVVYGEDDSFDDHHPSYKCREVPSVRAASPMVATGTGDKHEHGRQWKKDL